MKKTLPILCLVFIVLLVVSVPLAYKLGARHEAESIWVYRVIREAENDLRILEACGANHLDELVKRTEKDLWDSVLAINHYRERYNDSSTPDPDIILLEAARHFENHPIMNVSFDKITDHQLAEMAETRYGHIGLPHTTIADFLKSDIEKHKEVQDLLRAYLMDSKETPTTKFTLSSEAAPSAAPSER